MTENDSLSFQRRIRYQFESFCKKVICNERYNYMKQLQRHTEHETNFSALPYAYLSGFSSPDNTPELEYVFQVCGYCISLQNERLISALLNLPPEERSILLLHYALRLKDPEISRLLRTSRSRVQRIRVRAFRQLQDEMRR